MPQIEARRASRDDDRDAVLSIITLAFAQDPLWSRAMAISDGTAAHHSRFWSLFLDGAFRYSWVWLTEGGEAASVWIPPSGTEMTQAQEEELAELARDLLGEGAMTYLHLLERFAAAHPRTEPHYYLSLLGTHPDYRGHGIGMALLAHNLALVDAEGLPAYLESSNPANDRRYEGAGFRAVGEISYPGGGPLVTTMWRSPQ
jgi:GNAT superfamily N-acetyltransferase